MTERIRTVLSCGGSSFSLPRGLHPVIPTLTLAPHHDPLQTHPFNTSQVPATALNVDQVGEHEKQRLVTLGWVIEGV